MENLKTIDPSKGKLTINGIPISGFGENIIEIEYNEDSFTEKLGTDGHTTRIKNLNSNGKATVPLMQSSASNDALNLMANKDRVDNTGVGAFLFTDLSGRTIAAAPQCYVIKKPKWGMGKDVKENSWVFSLVNLQLDIGGNN
jgi:hypothetical protein